MSPTKSETTTLSVQPRDDDFHPDRLTHFLDVYFLPKPHNCLKCEGEQPASVVIGVNVDEESYGILPVCEEHLAAFAQYLVEIRKEELLTGPATEILQ